MFLSGGKKPNLDAMNNCYTFNISTNTLVLKQNMNETAIAMLFRKWLKEYSPLEEPQAPLEITKILKVLRFMIS